MTTKKGQKFLDTYQYEDAAKTDYEARLQWERKIHRWCADLEERIIRLEIGES